ncbi:N-acetyl-gamma-glutamyl-phosphate reductase [Verrucomicrobiota bacterium]
MIKAKIIGAGGYGGVGITELLLNHPEAEIQALVDIENIGKPLSELYPHLAGFCDLPILDFPDPKAIEPADVVFMATPDGVGMTLAPDAIQSGAKIIDYSGDFRFNTEKAYAEYATRIGRDPKHKAPELLTETTYGLPELHRKEITSDKKIIGNPGCFAVSCILGLAPAVKEKLIDTKGIICDAKTGVSGAGKKPSPSFHYPARHDNMNAYKLAGHQHVCEIEQELGLLSGSELNITFTSQVVPVCRGIMSTLYGRLNNNITESEVVNVYKKFYKADSFIRIYNSSADAGSAHTRGTNYCNLIISIDQRNEMLRIVSYIDNLVKGQAGSALQNMNLIFGLPETTGLDKPAIYP